ncbi:MAG: tRNA epoxyqueuosine(34) reductase QueG [Planctomycetales bacterium 4572_13]|nr:MAG: tRNA epoxyqueuosine(34) reductase QueG [Planctomycetales bacterium 4572_13]
MSLEAEIKQKALDLGFDAAGITTAEPVDAAHSEYFRKWLDDGCAAEMDYMHRNIDKRFDPGQLLKGAKSIICVALNYRPATDELLENPPVRIARFAQYEDYHPFIKDRLFQLAEFTKAERREPPDGDSKHARADQIKFKACIDSVPLAERALAQRAGLGFIGRNRMLIHPELGSQILLGELMTTLQLQPDEPFDQISCGDCGRCIRACPTGALNFDGSFDARKCISYQTIEAPTKAEQPDGDSKDARAGSYIFGCDECILACPHELNAPARKNADFQFHPEWQDLTPDQIQTMTADEFQKIFADSGFIRLGLDRLKRNVRGNRVG